MSPSNAYYYNDEGRVMDRLSLLDAGYLPKAVEAYGMAVKLDPSSPFFNITWGLSLEKLGQKADADEKLKAAFDLDSAFSSKTLIDLAITKYREGNKPGAFGILGDALRFNPISAEAYYCRGILYLDDKKKSLALKDFEKVKNLNPTQEKNPEIQNLDLFIQQAKK
jgi:tetratricopeptide (TPR) repeat protein